MLHRTYPDNTLGKSQTPSYLRQCLTYLKNNGYTFVSVAEILQSAINNSTLPDKSIAFTIDDGFDDQATLAAPVFIEFNCPVTIFLITDFINGKIWPWFSKIDYMIQNTNVNSIEYHFKQGIISRPLTTNTEKRIAIHEISESMKHIDWDFVDEALAHLSDITHVEIPETPPDQYIPMTWSMAQELEELGISFGPHTQTHPILSRVSEKQSYQEINQSWLELKEKLKHPAPVFCYPNGCLSDFGKREIEIVKNTEMLGALATIPKQFQLRSNIPDKNYILPRYSLPDNFNDFKMYSTWIEYAKEMILKR